MVWGDNAFFNKISIMPQRSVLLVKKAGVRETNDLGQVTDKPYYVRGEINSFRFVWYKTRRELTPYYKVIRVYIERDKKSVSINTLKGYSEARHLSRYQGNN